MISSPPPAPRRALRCSIAHYRSALAAAMAGRRILLLFIFDRLSSFAPAQLATTAELYRRYRQFQPQEGAR